MSIYNPNPMKTVIVLVISILFIFSCGEKDRPDRLDGDWDDNILLSTKNVTFKASMDSVSITTGGDGWWIDAISLDTVVYTYYNREDIDFEADSYSIQENDFLVERRNKKTLFIKLNANTTGKERIMNVSLQAGDYFDSVTVIQAAN